MVQVWSGKKPDLDCFMPTFGIERTKEPQSLEEMKRAQQRVAGIVG